MCLAVPGKIIEIKGNEAVVDYDIEKRKALLLEKTYKIGDYVIVQGKVVVQKIEKKEALDALRLYKQSVA
ncbi:MAG TPA: HypC/HybG/HupF family hydrogenase formation chaperone [Candidatus Nanoarchaeia archaeon]|nr:HypC/HybG/HupF family hydrogenase formation chaperone [Candidatus Nanoarchaeia archaeon]